MKRLSLCRRVLPILGIALLNLSISHAQARQHPPIPFTVHPSPRPLPDIEFKDGDERDLRLSNFRGRVIVINVWATWCAPCRREMPTLDRLQSKLGGPEFEVVALSIDRAGMDLVNTFFKEIEIRDLKRYLDQTASVMRKFAIVGIPTTLLIDRDGREIWRYAGAAEWDNDEWVGEIRKAIAGKGQ